MMSHRTLAALLASALLIGPGARAAEEQKQPEAKPAEAPKPAAGAAKGEEKKAEAPANAPRIEFEKETIDLGDVIKGEPAQFTFNFRNTGKSDLEVKEAKPSCGCTVADFTRTVKAGESGKVVATIDTKRFNGPITKTVTVTSTDPVNGSVHLQAKANVKALINVSPSENVYFRVFRGDEQPTKRVLTVTADKENAFEISKAESSNPAITVSVLNLAKGEAKPAPAAGDAAKTDSSGANYQLEVDVKKDAPIGPITGTVTVQTTHKKVPTITLNVNGQVLGEVMVTPQKVYLGQVTKDTAASIKRTVRIERRTGNGFKIEKVESSNPSIKAEVTPVEDGKVYTVTISVAGDLTPGQVNANVVLRTNDKEQAMIEIPVIGTVQG